MGERDRRVDAYISRQQAFAKPILTYLRDVIHAACPDVSETLKWSMPSFEYHGILCGFAAFKEHATFGFWKHQLVVGKQRAEGAMGGFGRLTSVDDLPPRAQLLALVRKAAELNEKGITAPRPKKKPRPAIPMPAAFRAALGRNKKAKATFEAFPPSHKREYLEYITEARRDETRERRIRQTIAWLAQGKPRNWKYL